MPANTDRYIMFQCGEAPVDVSGWSEEKCSMTCRIFCGNGAHTSGAR